MEEMNVFFIIEIIGTIAFASSGAMVAIKKELDLLGVIVLGVLTAVGGGMMRDILLGNLPPALFIHSIYAVVAFVTVLILFFLLYFHTRLLEGSSMETYEKIMNVFDAIGLGAFTVTGIDTAVAAGYGKYSFFVIVLGVLTGVGGGVLRDILAGQTPYILKKHFYACASIAGAVLYVILLPRIPEGVAMVISGCLVVAIRLLAAHFRWNLPKISASTTN